jgi:hypothetical protein
VGVAFGQQSGPPATHRQVQELTALVQAAGHVDFRDARGPLGLTQRQANGKFTRDEADELIARLEADANEEGHATAEGDATSDRGDSLRRTRPPKIDRRAAEQLALVRKVPDDVLAGELQRRGWVVLEP